MEKNLKKNIYIIYIYPHAYICVYMYIYTHIYVCGYIYIKLNHFAVNLKLNTTL